MENVEAQIQKLHEIAEMVRSSKKDKSSIMLYGEEGVFEPVQVIPTGSSLINYILGVGGFPKGRIAELYGQEGSGKCLAQSVLLVGVGDLGFSRIGDLAPGEMQPDEFTPFHTTVLSETGTEETSHLYYGGEQETIKVVTHYGYSLEGTKTHRVRVLEENGDIVWKALQDIAEGDYCVIKKGLDFGNGVDLSGFKFTPKSRVTNFKDGTVPKTLTGSLSRILGYLVAEGTATQSQKNSVIFSNHDEQVVNDYSTCMKETFGLEVRDRRQGNWVVHSVKVRQFLAYCGLGYTNSAGKEVPQCIMQAPKEHVVKFLQAYWEGDGGVQDHGTRIIQCCSASEKLIDQLQLLLLAFGIVGRKKHFASRATNTPNPRYRDYWMFTIGGRSLRTFHEEIGFISDRKRGMLAKVCAPECNPNRENIPNMVSCIKEFGQAIVTTCGTAVGGPDRKGKGRKTVLGERLTSRLLDIGGCGGSNLSYNVLGQLLEKAKDTIGETSVYKKLDRLYKLNYFYDPVVEISTGHDRVYDLTVPGSHSYVSNGFISHNSSIALSVVAKAQQQGILCVYIDSENALSVDFATKLGVDMDRLLLSQQSCTQEVFDTVDKCVDQGIGLVVIDSIAGLCPQQELDGDFGDYHVGLNARLIAQALRKLSEKVRQTKTVIICINQIRMRIGVMFGNPETTPGGRALKFYASIRLEVKVRSRLKSKDEVIGIRMSVSIPKNKVAPPFKKCETDFYFAYGFDVAAEYLDVAVSNEIFTKKGASHFLWPVVADKSKTRNGWLEYLHENPDALKVLVDTIDNL